MTEKLSEEEKRIRDLFREHGTAPIVEDAHPAPRRRIKLLTAILSVGGQKEGYEKKE